MSERSSNHPSLIRSILADRVAVSDIQKVLEEKITIGPLLIPLNVLADESDRRVT